MELKEKTKTACTIRVRGEEIKLDHAPTAGDIEEIGFKHIGGKFHVYNQDGQMVRKSEFPFTGAALDLREYHAPAAQFFVSFPEEVAKKLYMGLKASETASKKIREIVVEYYKGK
jgi:hypothetical protein